MTKLEKRAFRYLIKSLSTVSADRAGNLDLPGYKSGFIFASRRATETIEWLLSPGRKNKDVKLYARQGDQCSTKP